ncbi:MAG: MFS transporter [Deltaproteobacteria bacterium]|nr:MFS transporter [Deltaproteobacteria bacterium]
MPSAHKVLALNVCAFTVCFAAWTLNGVLVTFLTDNGLFPWGSVEIGWLLGIPVLTGSIFRLPAGMLTDKYGGKWIFGTLLLLCAIPMYFLSTATDFFSFALLSFGFGLAGTGFSIGIAYTSVWYPRQWQGTALGIFGMGNAGAAVTTLCAPALLGRLTAHGANLEGWRTLPKLYAAVLLAMGCLFLLLAENKKPEHSGEPLLQMLKPLKEIRVWRFGLYYFLVFGCFVGLAQWLVPYYVNVYSVSLVTAGLFASIFSLPSGVIRALGGWMSDHWGARRVMYWILGLSTACCLLLIFPRMDLFTPGKGVMAQRAGMVAEVSERRIVVEQREYIVTPKTATDEPNNDQTLVWPTTRSWQEPVVHVGDSVKKKQLLARGVTHIFFQANIWIATFLIFIVGIVWGIGKAAVYKHIPEYFPRQVGVVGGMVGVLGGLGGFVGPVIFGYLLQLTGLWTSMWMFLAGLSVVCLYWMHRVVKKMTTLPEAFERMPHVVSTQR